MNKIFQTFGEYLYYAYKEDVGRNGHYPLTLAKDIRRYFERNANAVEVLIMKGARAISVTEETPFVCRFIKKIR